MNFGIAFAPLVPAYVLWAAVAVALVIVSAARSACAAAAPAIRAVALALIVLALANPSFTREDRDPIPSVAAIVIDKSPSQNFGERAKQAEDARGALDRAARRAFPASKSASSKPARPTARPTARACSMRSTPIFADVPPDRIAGAFLITDGRVHDVPADAASLGFAAPVHALITGTGDERDRRVVLTSAPRFGIVGQSQIIAFRVEDQGTRPSAAARHRAARRRDRSRAAMSPPIPACACRSRSRMPGPNIVEIEASPLEGELTPINNRAVVSIDGVRDKLRVLLVSGEPHAGERTWRNLLKSDASVDLVHFTILRPPEKQDGTPINELSLIAFPTRELFQQKIGEFHLIIFDRYARQGVLPIIYFDNIAKYVRDGGAVMIAAGPDYASPTSLWRTPLDVILPAEPAGTMTERAFHARLSAISASAIR